MNERGLKSSCDTPLCRGTIDPFLISPADLVKRDTAAVQNNVHEQIIFVEDEDSVKSLSRAEVVREKDVVVIGDLHGNIEALYANLFHVAVINEKNEWIAHDIELVFSGDILGDRHMNGIEILLEIERLKGEAEKFNSNINVLVGNHDAFVLILLLFGKNSFNERVLRSAFSFNSQVVGILEFYEYINEIEILLCEGAFVFEIHIQYLLCNLYNIVNKIKSTDEGFLLLNAICGMKLACKLDDSVITHTGLSASMASFLIDADLDVEMLNNEFQSYLSNVLLGDASFLRNRNKTELCHSFFDSFLRTNNRSSWEGTDYFIPEFHISGPSEEQYKALKKLGMNVHVHGHSVSHPDSSRLKMHSGVACASVDFGAYINEFSTNERSVLILSKNGQIDMGVDLKTVMDGDDVL